MDKVKQITDRKLPTKLDPQSLESAQRGQVGKGLSEKTLNESLADFGHNVDISER